MIMVSVREKIGPLKIECYMPASGEIGKIEVPSKSRWTVLFFYPGDFTFVCPTELEELAHVYKEIRALGAEIVSVSTDGVYVHKGWVEAEKGMLGTIKFPMGSDRTGELSRYFGCYDSASGMSERMTVIIDSAGIVRSIETVDKDIGRGARELIRKIKALKFVSENKGQVCVASWEMGMQTLRPGIGLAGHVSEKMKK